MASLVSTIPLLSGRLVAPSRASRGVRRLNRAPSVANMERQDFDAQYVRRLTEGDASVVRHFAAYFTELIRIKLRRHGWTAHEIEDIRQETFLRVFRILRQKDGLEHPERLGAFVNSVCNNIVLESYKARARHSTFDPAEDEPIDHRVDLDRGLLANEKRQLVRTVLDELPEPDRILLRRVFFEEADRDEVCRAMNVDRGYLRVLLHRALVRFKDLAKKGRSPALAHQ